MSFMLRTLPLTLFALFLLPPGSRGEVTNEAMVRATTRFFTSRLRLNGSTIPTAPYSTKVVTIFFINCIRSAMKAGRNTGGMSGVMTW